MMMRLLFAPLTACLLAPCATAAPCVSSTFDKPVPNAVDVVAHVSDIPSAHFPAFWQQGRLAGFRYQIFADLTGVVQANTTDDLWSVELECKQADANCVLVQKGAPPAEALDAAVQLGYCLKGENPPEPAPEAEPRSNPEPAADPLATTETTAETTTGAAAGTGTETGPETGSETGEAAGQANTANTAAAQQEGTQTAEALLPSAAETNPEAETEAETAQPSAVTACGIQLTNETTQVATMQRLLTLLGTDPGPVDGFLGPQTFTAMREFVDHPDWGTSIPDMIALLDAQHCAQSQ